MLRKSFYVKIYRKLTIFRERIRDGYNEQVVVSHEFKKNFVQLIDDVRDGRSDDESNDNIKNTVGDIIKMAGIGAVFVLPGGSAGVIAIKKFLESDRARKMGIPNFLELSISMKVAPLNPMPDVPVFTDGAFGFARKHDIHTGVDLYCEPGATVYAIECGEVVDIMDFTGVNAESPWWNETRAVLVEGPSGVFVYGEIKEREGLKIGDNVECGDILGEVVTVLQKDKGKPMTMLHLELYEHKFRDVVWWKHGHPKPDPLQDPTEILTDIKKKI
jgi:hypothetical protein